MSLKSAKLSSLADKLEPSIPEEVLDVPSDKQKQESKIKASKKPSPDKSKNK